MKFSSWWKNNIAEQLHSKSITYSLNTYEKISALFVGIWGRKNSRRATTAQIIDKIDQRLKNANLCQGSTGKIMTPNIVPVKDIPDNIIPFDARKKIASTTSSNPYKLFNI